MKKPSILLVLAAVFSLISCGNAKKEVPKNMRRIIASALVLLCAGSAFAQEKEYPKPERMTPGMTEFWTPQPAIVTPGDILTDSAPSDAVVLFDGKNLDAWVSANGGEAKWPVHDGVFTVDKKAGDILTRESFGSFQLYNRQNEMCLSSNRNVFDERLICSKRNVFVF